MHSPAIFTSSKNLVKNHFSRRGEKGGRWPGCQKHFFWEWYQGMARQLALAPGVWKRHIYIHFIRLYSHGCWSSDEKSCSFCRTFRSGRRRPIFLNFLISFKPFSHLPSIFAFLNCQLTNQPVFFLWLKFTPVILFRKLVNGPIPEPYRLFQLRINGYPSNWFRTKYIWSKTLSDLIYQIITVPRYPEINSSNPTFPSYLLSFQISLLVEMSTSSLKGKTIAITGGASKSVWQLLKSSPSLEPMFPSQIFLLTPSKKGKKK